MDDAGNGFLEAIVQAVRDRTSPNFLVGVRLSPELRSGGIELADALQTLDACLALDLDFIHVSCWDYTATCEHEGTEQLYTRHGSSQRIDGKVPLISTGGVWDSDDALHVVKQGADFVGAARWNCTPQLADLPWRRDERSKTSAVQCQRTHGGLTKSRVH